MVGNKKGLQKNYVAVETGLGFVQVVFSTFGKGLRYG
jgi:hypothetical protein